jgi:hypothetical protein
MRLDPHRAGLMAARPAAENLNMQDLAALSDAIALHQGKVIL